MTLGSLNSEDLHGRPGPARAAALRAAAGDPRHRLLHLTDACYGALAAGEAKHALHLLDQLDRATGAPDRHLAALRAWALQLDGNWYPGGMAAESSLDPAGAFVTPAPGSPETELIEHLVADGPPSLATVRAVIEDMLRSGNAVAAGQMATQGISALGKLSGLAHRHGAVALGHWCDIAAADLMRRVGRDEQATRLLEQARTATTLLNLPGLVAVTYLVEGDWSATPGSHPESLGFDLAHPSGRRPAPARRDPDRAAVSYTAAASWAAGLPLPRLHAALELRQATLAWFAGDQTARRRHLNAARAAWTTAGDTAGVQLCAVHLLIADLDEGAPGDPGTVPGVLEWAATVGSRTWCAGLGRLVQRAAEHWRGNGSVARARAGYLAALPLLAGDPGLPARDVVMDLACLESRNGLADTALDRLEQLLSVPAGGPPDVALTRQLEITAAMITAHRCSTGDATSGLEELRSRLQTMLAAAAGPRRLPAGVSVTARDQLILLDTLIPLTRAAQADRQGHSHQADPCYQAALATAPAHLRPLILVSAERYAEARAALVALPPRHDLALPAVQAGDLAYAQRSLTRDPTHDWHDALTAALLALARRDPRTALSHARAGIALLEEFAATLPATDRETLHAHEPVRRLYLAESRALALLARAERSADLRRRSYPGAAPPEVPPGTLLLTYRTAGPDLMTWTTTSDDISAHHRHISPRRLAALIRRFPDHAADLAHLLLTDPARLIRRHRRLVIAPHGVLTQVPFPELPFDGHPLRTTHTLSEYDQSEVP
jgi:hypothetical protein